jgi:hypothetical protein
MSRWGFASTWTPPTSVCDRAGGFERGAPGLTDSPRSASRCFAVIENERSKPGEGTASLGFGLRYEMVACTILPLGMEVTVSSSIGSIQQVEAVQEAVLTA